MSTSRSQAPIEATTRQADDVTSCSSTPMLTSPRPGPAGNPRNKSQNDISSAPLINQNLVPETRISDPPNVPAHTSRSDMPMAQLGPMPLKNVPTQQTVSAEKDLEPTPVHGPFKSFCRSGANPEKVLHIRGGAMQVYHHNQ